MKLDYVLDKYNNNELDTFSASELKEAYDILCKFAPKLTSSDAVFKVSVVTLLCMKLPVSVTTPNKRAFATFSVKSLSKQDIRS